MLGERVAGDSPKSLREDSSEYIAVHVCFAEDPTSVVLQPRGMGVGAAWTSSSEPSVPFRRKSKETPKWFPLGRFLWILLLLQNRPLLPRVPSREAAVFQPAFAEPSTC